MRDTSIQSILIIGSGPIIIGQACEFDYSGSQASRSLREEGIKVSLINSNPATIMTDPVTADHIYLRPLTPESIEPFLQEHQESAPTCPTLTPCCPPWAAKRRSTSPSSAKKWASGKNTACA
jgi:carbamoyl-phosphate synthase large subunit